MSSLDGSDSVSNLKAERVSYLGHCAALPEKQANETCKCLPRRARAHFANTVNGTATMRGQRFWVHNGDLEPVFGSNALSAEAEERAYIGGSVRLTTGDLGTEVKWNVNSPCVTSLFKAIQWLPTVKPPFILRFFAVGWFEEVYREAKAAQNRVEQVLTRGDRHFTSRVFIKEARSDNGLMPDAMKEALTGQGISTDYSIDCTYDEAANQFQVDRVGPKSAIGRVWGTYTTSHPCQSAGSYGDPVNATYESVIKTNQPRYDHVLAALRLPDNALHWVPYHRVVFPRRNGKGQAGVAVVSQISRVDIQVL
jgi:hypothetical protein